jgi:glycosyltransferase involved in cell wall biosynthesis
VADGVTGLLVPPDDASALLARARWLWDHPESAAAMGRRARVAYETHYTAEANYQALMRVYQEAGVAGAWETTHEAARDAG